jgi:hypothetical protein
LTDAATGGHDHLLDLIALRSRAGIGRGAGVSEAASVRLPCPARSSPATRGPYDAARRAFAISRAIADALAEAYLRHRGVSPAAIAVAVFRFQSRRYHPETDDALRLLLVA